MPHMSVDEQHLALKIKELVESADLESMTVKSLRLELESYFNVDLTSQKAVISTLVKDALQTRLGAFGPETPSAAQREPIASNSSKEEQEEADRLLAFKLHAEESRRGSRRQPSSALPGSKSLKNKRLYAASDTPARKKATRSTPSGTTNGFPESKLSPALSEFLGGLTVSTSSKATKLIWEHIKSQELQDPKDRRYILCDEKLYKILGKSRIHMFHIAKELHKHLYPLDAN